MLVPEAKLLPNGTGEDKVGKYVGMNPRVQLRVPVDFFPKGVTSIAPLKTDHEDYDDNELQYRGENGCWSITIEKCEGPAEAIILPGGQSHPKLVTASGSDAVDIDVDFKLVRKTASKREFVTGCRYTLRVSFVGQAQQKHVIDLPEFLMEAKSKRKRAARPVRRATVAAAERPNRQANKII